ncbi:MAG: DUF1778 domain-containing protein [Planctomycetota bacterium]|nr:DUF1778 domain-containing protein [Planctomycetota bacterium]
MSTNAIRKDAHLRLRLSSIRKEHCERIAAECGQSLSDFVMQAIEERVTREQRDRQAVRVAEADAVDFATWMQDPHNHLPADRWNRIWDQASRISG